MMKISARNQFPGTVTKITEGQAMAEVTVKVGTLEFRAGRRESHGSHDRQVVRVHCPDYGFLPLRRVGS